MKIRINVDLDVPRWVQNTILGLVTSAALLGVGLGVKAWAAPVTIQTFAQNEKLTSQKLNDQLGALQAAVNQSAPPGTIMAYGGPIDGNPSTTIADAGAPQHLPPAGWLWCNGDAISRDTYRVLFAAIAIAHGGGDGVNTFNLPDYRGRFLRGVDGNAGRDPDAATRTVANSGGYLGNMVGSIESDGVGPHTHAEGTMANSAGTTGSGLWGGQNWVEWAGGYLIHFNGNTYPNDGTETRPVNAAVNYIIRY